MKAKLLTLLTWTFYAGLIYTAFNPAHEYLTYLDNTRTLYLIFNIPMTLFMGAVAGFIYIGKGFVVATGLEKAAEEKDKDPEKFKKVVESLENIENKHKILIPLSRFFTIVTAFVSVIILGDALLGTVMILGAAFTHILVNQIKSFAKELKNALK